MNRKISTQGKDGYVPVVRAGGEMAELMDFSLLRLGKGQVSEEINLQDKEVAIVILSGLCDISARDFNWQNLGERTNVFEGPATALYLPPEYSFRVKAKSSVEIALTFARAKKASFDPVLIRPKDVSVSKRGFSNLAREVHRIILENVQAEKLLVGETFNPPGNWSSYPPHKHDRHDPPRECKLEEIYFFKVLPAQGFGIQRIYSPDDNLDDLYLIQNNDVIIVPRGYHPVVAAPGYSLYYLWVLAGSAREMWMRDDPEHSWVKDLELHPSS